MSKVTQYWDNTRKIGVYVEDGKIRHFFHKKPFKSYCLEVNYSLPINVYANVGTAYHSGNEGVHISDFLGSQSIVDVSREMKVSIATNYSICDENCDYSEFYHKNMRSFYTPEVDLMPLIGYVVLKEHIIEPLHSFYEMQNLIKKEEKAIEFDSNLNGDNLGQMALALSCGTHVLNSICVTPFQNFFYRRVLSATRLEGNKSEVVLARIKEIKPVVPCAYDLASKWCVPSKDIGIDTYGDCLIHLIRDDEIAQINTIGYLTKFSGGKCPVIYSYNMAVSPDFEAGWNCINPVK